MVNADDLKEAIELRIKSLRSGIRENEEMIASVDKWVAFIQVKIDIAKRAFDCVVEPVSVLRWNPESGEPYVVVEVRAHGKSVAEIHRQYEEYLDEAVDVEGHGYFEAILDLTPVVEGGSGDEGSKTIG